ncbi:hypothetical protein BGW36DRAFT_432603 [Talaromyces proteolyticus]|uniref:Uncharacterized protein n=1 Tax=Talaromyces proteolyticus TaxID=1131652 RepID=A0AAD4KG09_9EURO|nr:uncharacterized protein BGW36DRAFT_432603 [Talaromyces proteolyticus]KAH8690821.1 hypothetical protein BGW36DRAFT_432603 [Talaromyces proteolyticus]
MITLTIWTAFATVAFVLTAWFASTTFSVNPAYEIQSSFHISFADTVTILRVIQGLTSWATASAVAASFEIAMWASAAAETGSPILTLLTISPTTGIWGILSLVCSKTATGVARTWGSARLSLLAIYTLGSIVLFINTSTMTSYYPISTFNVLAGTGPFNASLIGPFLQQFNTTIPYFALASSYSFINNPAFSISLEPSCSGSMTPCDSYLLPGGIYLMWPQLSGNVSDGSVVSIQNAPAMRIDFTEGLGSDDNFFSASDCTVYGDGLAAVNFCLSESNIHHGSLKAGVYVCTNGTRDGQCLASSESGSTPNVTTTFTTSSYTASSVNSVENSTILSVFNLVAQEAAAAVDVQTLSLAIGWLLNYTAANLPPESSPDFQFWETGSDTYQTIWQTNSYIMLKSILGFILWEFSVNNDGNLAVLYTEPNGLTPDLPSEFHTTASICIPLERFVLDRTYFIVYIVFQSVALVFCWSVVLWAGLIRKQLPEITSMAAVDFGAKLRSTQTLDEKLFSQVRREDGNKQIRYALQGVRVTSYYKEKPEAVEPLMKKDEIGQIKVRRRASWP